MIIGITGGIAAGKSTVADCFRKQGCAVFSADSVAKSCLDDPDVVEVLHEIFAFEGNLPRFKDGKVDREWLASRLFSNSPWSHKRRARLESCIHPKVQRIMDEFIKINRHLHPIVLDVPLLLERGLQYYCDKIVFVYAPYSVRAKRMCCRGKSEDWTAREMCQFSVEQKEWMSDVVVPSYEGSHVDLDGFVKDILTCGIPAKVFLRGVFYVG